MYNTLLVILYQKHLDVHSISFQHKSFKRFKLDVNVDGQMLLQTHPVSSKVHEIIREFYLKYEKLLAVGKIWKLNLY